MFSKILIANGGKIIVSRERNRMRFFVATLELLGSLLVASEVARAQPTSPSSDPTVGFVMGYGYSVIYDGCGYPDLGPVLRGAIRERVEQCPFPADTKKQFAAQADRFDGTLNVRLDAYTKQHGAFPTDGLGDFKCPKGSLEDPVTRLRKFKLKEITLKELLPEPCEAGGAMAPPTK